MNKALPVCTRLADILEEKRLEQDGLCIHVTLGMAEFLSGQDKGPMDLMARARKDLENNSNRR